MVETAVYDRENPEHSRIATRTRTIVIDFETSRRTPLNMTELGEALRFDMAPEDGRKLAIIFLRYEQFLLDINKGDLIRTDI
jgi:hypothetical protein